MQKSRVVYICRVCHRVNNRPLTCHPRASVKCDAGAPGDARSIPVFDAHEHLLTRAPKWWVEACSKSKKAKAKSEKQERGTLKPETLRP